MVPHTATHQIAGGLLLFQPLQTHSNVLWDLHRGGCFVKLQTHHGAADPNSHRQEEGRQLACGSNEAEKAGAKAGKPHPPGAKGGNSQVAVGIAEKQQTHKGQKGKAIVSKLGLIAPYTVAAQRIDHK